MIPLNVHVCLDSLGETVALTLMNAPAHHAIMVALVLRSLRVEGIHVNARRNGQDLNAELISKIS